MEGRCEREQLPSVLQKQKKKNTSERENLRLLLFALIDRMLASSQGAGEQGDVPVGGTTPAQGDSAVPAKSRLPVRYFFLERLHPLSQTHFQVFNFILPFPTQQNRGFSME